MSFNIPAKYGPLLIAEIGGNHEGNFEYAKELIQLAIESDVDAIKLQMYTGDTLVSEVENPIRNKHFKKFEFSKEQYIELISLIKDAGKMFTASIWDKDLIEIFDDCIDFYKVGSGDFTALPLLKLIASKNKPIVLSTGLSNEQEVIEIVNFVKKTNKMYEDKGNIGVLQCTAMYPINNSDANLAVLDTYKSKLNVSVGYSDHTIGSKAILYSIIKGAEIVEFHFTDKKENREFRDHQVSLTKNDVFKLIKEIEEYNIFNGSEIKKPLEIELESNHVETFRRSVYFNKDISAGTKITEEDLIVLRPNVGIDAREYYNIIGKIVAVDIKKHEAFTEDCIRNEV